MIYACPLRETSGRGGSRPRGSPSCHSPGCPCGISPRCPYGARAPRRRWHRLLRHQTAGSVAQPPTPGGMTAQGAQCPIALHARESVNSPSPDITKATMVSRGLLESPQQGDAAGGLSEGSPCSMEPMRTRAWSDHAWRSPTADPNLSLPWLPFPRVSGVRDDSSQAEGQTASKGCCLLRPLSGCCGDRFLSANLMACRSLRRSAASPARLPMLMGGNLARLLYIGHPPGSHGRSFPGVSCGKGARLCSLLARRRSARGGRPARQF